MYKTFVLSLMLLASAAWVQAQAYPQSAPTQVPDETAGAKSGQMTVQGCLMGSGGSYSLTADNGMMYQLTGHTSNLTTHVGHEVEITGKPSASSSSSASSAESTPSSSMSGSSQGSTLEVKSMKHIAATCKSAGK